MKKEIYNNLKEIINEAKELGGFYFIGFDNINFGFKGWHPPDDTKPKDVEILFFVLPNKIIHLNPKSKTILKSMKNQYLFLSQPNKGE